MLTLLAVHGYRSLREVVLPLAPVTVITGANGVGKSSLYQSLRLLADTGRGSLVGALAGQGGLSRVMWAGPEEISGAMKRGEVPVQGTGSRRRPISLALGFATDTFGYLVDVGLPTPRTTAFVRDPVIKREAIFAAPLYRPASSLVERKNHTLRVNAGPGWRVVAEDLDDRASMLAELGDPQEYPEVLAVRREVNSWRFYDGFRTDADAPARQPHVGTWTPVLSDDGADLAPAVQSILESSWERPFRQAIAEAFPGGRIAVTDHDGRFEIEFDQSGLLRSLNAAELSDGTLRFLLLATALLSPRPPAVLVLNEPETSLHPDVLPVLARLVQGAASRTQVIVVSHSSAIVDHLLGDQDPGDRDPGGQDPLGPGDDDAPRDGGATVLHHRLTKNLGETVVEGQGLLSRPPWNWGAR
ncbi:AAA family ATPase [Aestuariimicrobium kwangyangense]|uniref:AAA family ATPase n=1 Tax=Aestuariimicrobium kwangyangense TaxID=396389 RepID=UPI0003B450F9|nr:AAA family ATPase [Aestuariimicrobium kwangyangense]